MVIMLDVFYSNIFIRFFPVRSIVKYYVVKNGDFLTQSQMAKYEIHYSITVFVEICAHKY